MSYKSSKITEGEKSRKDTANSGKLVSTIGISKSMKANIGNKVINVMESLIGLGVTVTD